MQDILVQSDALGRFDICFEGGDLVAAPGFESAILVSLFTDARAPKSAVADPIRRRGWVGNVSTADTGRELGGTLWLYDQARLTDETIVGIRRAAEKSLAWMIEDGVAQRVDVDVTKRAERTLEIFIQITANTGGVTRYSTLWKATDLSSVLGTKVVPTVEFSTTTDFQLAGGQPFTFTVTRDKSEGLSHVDWVVSGTGANPTQPSAFIGGQYPHGRVVFLPGQTTATVEVSTAVDTAIEPDTTFAVTLQRIDTQVGDADTAVGTLRTAQPSILGGWVGGDWFGETYDVPVGQDRMLLFFSATRTNAGTSAGITTAEYGGQSLVKAGEVFKTDGSSSNRLELWYADEAAIQAAQDAEANDFNVSAFFGSSNRTALIMVALQGVNQTGGASTFPSIVTDSIGGGSTAHDIDVTNAIGELILGATSMSDAIGSEATLSANWSKDADQDSSPASAPVHIVAGEVGVGDDTSVENLTAQWSISGANSTIMGVRIAPPA